MHDDLDGTVRELTALLATRSGVTQRAVKETVARILDGVTADDEAHAVLRAAAFDAPDYAEGVRAFLERRPPGLRLSLVNLRLTEKRHEPR